YPSGLMTSTRPTQYPFGMLSSSSLHSHRPTLAGTKRGHCGNQKGPVGVKWGQYPKTLSSARWRTWRRRRSREETRRPASACLEQRVEPNPTAAGRPGATQRHPHPVGDCAHRPRFVILRPGVLESSRRGGKSVPSKEAAVVRQPPKICDCSPTRLNCPPPL